MFPVVASLVGAWVADEPLNGSVAIGAVLAIAGVYVGALAPTKRDKTPERGSGVVS
jgi:drug/metabolite transporter (DMT)-like permease